jgi:uncharacterized cupredoxin-like copper-binding protein
MKTKKSFTILLVLMLFIVPALTACGPQKVNVDLTSYKLNLSTNSVPAGDIAFHITNSATDQKHEFLIFKTDLPIDKLPTAADGSVDEEGGAAQRVFDSGELDPGASVDMTQNLAAGNYVVVCNMTINGVNHYQAGMRDTFTVK